MRYKAIQIFDVEEFSTPGGYYCIVVQQRGRTVETITTPTMAAAHAELERRYQRIEKGVELRDLARPRVAG